MRRRQRRQLCGSGSGVEHRLAKARVASSNLVFRSNFFPGVAQFGSVLDWGSRGRGFKSRHSDHRITEFSGSVIFYFLRNLFAARASKK